MCVSESEEVEVSGRQEGERAGTNLVRASAPQLEPARLPRAHAPVDADAHHDGDARARLRAADRRDLVERDLLDRRALLVALHLREDGALDEVDGAQAALGAADDGDRRRRVDGEAVDAALEAEPRVGARQLVHRLARARVPQDQGRVLGRREDLLACFRAVVSEGRRRG